MAMKEIKTKFILRNDTSAKWEQVNPVLSKGEIGIENDTYKFKIGNGTKAWKDLDYAVAGAADVVVDNDTIELSADGELRLTNFGVEYYKWVDAVGVEGEEGYVEGHYELQVVDETHPWIAGLEPKVVSKAEGGFEIAWYAPSATTLEGLQDIVGTVTTELDTVKESVSGIKDEIGTKTDETTDTVWGAINKNAGDITELKGKISGVFHFKGAAPEGGLDAITNPEVGDVYTIDNVEWVWNGTEWFELGETVDLAPLITRLDDVEKKAHTHDNKTLLDTLTEEKFNAWDSAQTNLIESINVNGTALPIVDKAVNIPAATAAALGLVKVDNNTIESVNGVIGVKAIGVTKIYVEDGTELVLNGGDASTSSV